MRCKNCGEEFRLKPIAKLGFYPCFCLRKWNAIRRILSCRAPNDKACWIFDGNIRSDGYGSMNMIVHGRGVSPAHRISYLLFNGSLVVGKEINHICRNKSCVNPDHLEQITHSGNMLWRNFTKTHCLNGHEYTPENTIWDASMRCKRCRKCRENQCKL